MTPLEPQVPAVARGASQTITAGPPEEATLSVSVGEKSQYGTVGRPERMLSILRSTDLMRMRLLSERT
jgi:hypothetical protein